MSARVSQELATIIAALAQREGLLDRSWTVGTRIGDLDDLAAAWTTPAYLAEGVDTWLGARCCATAAKMLGSLHVDFVDVAAPSEVASEQEVLGRWPGRALTPPSTSLKQSKPAACTPQYSAAPWSPWSTTTRCPRAESRGVTSRLGRGSRRAREGSGPARREVRCP